MLSMRVVQDTSPHLMREETGGDDAIVAVIDDSALALAQESRHRGRTPPKPNVLRAEAANAWADSMLSCAHARTM